MERKFVPSYADLISISRVPLAFLFMYFFDQKILASLILLTGWFSDVADGYVARTAGRSAYGSQIDAATDKFFNISVILFMLHSAAIGSAQTAILLMRDMYVLLLMAIAYPVVKKRKMKYLLSIPEAKLSGKETTGLQFIVILTVLSGSSNAVVLFYLLFVSGIVTMADYTLVFIRRLLE